MSDLFRQALYFHVFVSDGDITVSDSADGDRRLLELAKQYPSATVTVKDRDTGQALADEMPLPELLHARGQLMCLSITPPGKEVV